MDKNEAARRRLLVAARRWAKAKRAVGTVYSQHRFDVVEAAECARQHRLAEKALLRAVDGLDG